MHFPLNPIFVVIDYGRFSYHNHQLYYFRKTNWMCLFCKELLNLSYGKIIHYTRIRTEALYLKVIINSKKNILRTMRFLQQTNH